MLTAADAPNGEFDFNGLLDEATVRTWLSCLMPRARMAVLLYEKFQPEPVNTGVFIDIDECTEAQQLAINSLAAAGILQGVKQTVFQPNGVVTRAQLAVLVDRTRGVLEGADTQAIFNDIDPAAWYAASINSLVAKGVLTAKDGIGGCFRPKACATAEDLTNWLQAIPVDAPAGVTSYEVEQTQDGPVLNLTFAADFATEEVAEAPETVLVCVVTYDSTTKQMRDMQMVEVAVTPGANTVDVSFLENGTTKVLLLNGGNCVPLCGVFPMS